MTPHTPYLASLPRRAGGAAIDIAPMLLLVIIIFSAIDDAIGLHRSAALLAAFLVFVAYHATFQYQWSGETPGCRMVGIRVVSGGRTPDVSVVQCIARPMASVIWLCSSLPFAVMLSMQWIAFVPAFLSFAMISSLPSRQTVPDLLCRTLVVRTPPVQPHRAPAAPMFSVADAEFGYKPRRAKRTQSCIVS